MAYRVRVVPKKKRRGIQQGKNTKKPYGGQDIENCLTWPLVKAVSYTHLTLPTICSV